MELWKRDFHAVLEPEPHPQWFRTAKNPDVSIGLALAPLIKLLASLACYAALIHSLACSLPNSWKSEGFDVSK